jgi:tetratricopeptide (TPR) repeat protein
VEYYISVPTRKGVLGLNPEQYEQRMEKARKLMNEKKIDEAEKILRKLLPEAENIGEKEKIIVLNNLASIAHLREKDEQGLALLEPYLQADTPVESPYTFGLAAQMYARLDRRDEAKRCLNQAVKIYDKKLPHLREQGLDPQSWYEYTVQLMRAAGALGDHRRVIDLYKKYERYHVSWENRYGAGIACFNLKRYKQAASIWDPLNRIGNFIIPMQRVAFLMERDVIPHFALSYEPPDWDEIEEKFRDAEGDREKQEEALQTGLIRMVMLDTLFDEQREEKEKKNAIQLLVSFGGEWGKELALGLLESALVLKEVKMSAVFALVERGVYKEGEEVPVLIDGKETVVKVEKKEISMEPDQELDPICDRALALRDEGKIDEAIALLEPLYQRGNFYPRAMITLANLYRNKKEWEPAREILEILADGFPDEPVIIVNLAGLCLERGAFDQALQYIDRFDMADLNEEFKKKVDYIRSMAEQRLTPYDAMERLKNLYKGELEEDLRSEIEEKKITPESTLSRGLRNMPNEWLLNICELHGIAPRQQRLQREKAIISHLSDPAHLKEATRKLNSSEQEMLAYLLGRDGWAPLSAVSRKFGKMEGDGFYWDEEEPQSTTGKLWSKGLVIVGRAIIKNRQVKIAAVPADLRPLLEQIL